MKPVVWCFHGSPGVPEEFSEMASRLVHGKVVAQNRPGYQHGKEVGELDQSADSFLVLGYSWGGYDAVQKAVQLATAKKKKVLGLMLVAPYLFPKEQAGGVQKALLGAPVLGDILLNTVGRAKMLKYLEKSCEPKSFPSACQAAAEVISEPRNMRRALAEKAVAKEKVLEQLHELESLSVPVMVVWGVHDQTGNYDDQVGQISAVVSPMAVEKLEDAGHAIPWTHGRELAQIVDRWIEQLK